MAVAGVSAEDVIVVQCDADTTYSDGYVSTLASAARDQPRALAEARTELPPGFADRYPTVTQALDEVDSAFERRFPPSDWNVVVDDKACAFSLQDYRSWGGHRREIFLDGTEALAETSRLLIAARAAGAPLVQALDALAVHSPRRLYKDAAQFLATSGFPYEHRRALPASGRVGIEELEQAAVHQDMDVLDLVLALRRRHLLALQALLPAHLEHSIEGRPPGPPEIDALLDHLPHRSSDDASVRPAVFFEDVLRLVWEATCPEFEALAGR
jgi:hypothetical protein